MEIEKTVLPGVLVVHPRIFRDERGYFYESYHQQKYQEAGIDTVFVQDNESRSVQGVVRGLHYQLNPHAQAKLVRVLEGTVFDVAVDIRKGSPTYGKWFGVELSAENKKQLYIPEGFAHGFSVLSEEAVLAYKCNALYHQESERGIALDDPDLGIDWQVSRQAFIVSEKDKKSPLFRDAEMNFIFADHQI
jgi:dTDP-4-dehydrorhamnose 3,5-epimerase